MKITINLDTRKHYEVLEAEKFLQGFIKEEEIKIERERMEEIENDPKKIAERFNKWLDEFLNYKYDGEKAPVDIDVDLSYMLDLFINPSGYSRIKLVKMEIGEFRSRIYHRIDMLTSFKVKETGDGKMKFTKIPLNQIN